MITVEYGKLCMKYANILSYYDAIAKKPKIPEYKYCNWEYKAEKATKEK